MPWDAPSDASASAHKRKMIEVSELAAEEIRSRMARGGFPDGIGVRITPTKWADSGVEITFDYPVSDGRDWVDESQGLLLLVDKNDEPHLAGCVIDFRDGASQTKRAPRVRPTSASGVRAGLRRAR